MDMSKLSSMKMPEAKSKSQEISLVAKPVGEESSEPNPALAKVPEMDMLDELKARGCVDEKQYAAISAQISSTGSPDEEASESPEEAASEDEASEIPSMGKPY